MTTDPTLELALGRTARNRSGARPHYDAVVVGARVAGAATAMLLARNGLRVLAVDRDGYGTDTLSTHALMRGGVTQLERWGVADALRAVSPAITRTVFHYGESSFELSTVDGGKTPLMAPRRTVLDRVMVDAARDAGVDVRHRVRVTGIEQHPSGRVVGVELAEADGRTVRVGADIVIGADGLNSTVARHLDVPITRQGAEAGAYVTGYLEDLDLPTDAYQWQYEIGIGAGYIPTTDGQFVVFAATTRDRFRHEIRADTHAGFHRVLDEVNPEFGAVVRDARLVGSVRAWPGLVGQFRKAYGPGWALVGDAGYFKDPYVAHGISDALRDAELLAEAVVTGDFARYETTRDRLSAPLFGALEDIASFRWTLEELSGIHQTAGKAMSAEQKELARLRSGQRITVTPTGVPAAPAAATAGGALAA